jgi:hypothetical protein
MLESSYLCKGIVKESLWFLIFVGLLFEETKRSHRFFGSSQIIPVLFTALGFTSEFFILDARLPSHPRRTTRMPEPSDGA